MSRKIILTGGGTAGHVTANIALLPLLKRDGYEAGYIGSEQGIERQLIAAEGIPYYAIPTGKLRRYFDLKNFTDPFRVIAGFFKARQILKRVKPNVVFSKGGYVSVPVVWAAHSLGIPAVIHESDMTPGLANRLSIRYAEKVCCNFPETVSSLPAGKAVLTGSAIRQRLLEGTREEGLEMTGFDGTRPVLMIIGGSLGAASINEAVRKELSELLLHFDIIHVCGKGNRKDELEDPRYRQFEYVRDGLRNLYALADVVISRAGANVICELAALHKPNVLIPLPLEASRGDQILNAESFRKQGFSLVLDQHEMEKDPARLLEAVKKVYEDRESYRKAMEMGGMRNGAETIEAVIRSAAEKGEQGGIK